jgi:hypothetical protein
LRLALARVDFDFHRNTPSVAAVSATRHRRGWKNLLAILMVTNLFSTIHLFPTNFQD